MKKGTILTISFFLFACVSGLTGYIVYLHQDLFLKNNNWEGWALAAGPMAAWLIFAMIVASLPSGKGEPQKDEGEVEGDSQEPPPESADKEEEAQAIQEEEKDIEKLYPKEVAVVQLLGLLQREGRLIDFLQEDIEPYEDAQIGAAVREVHRGCRNALMNTLELRPVLDAGEGSEVEIEEDFDPSKIRLIGNLHGNPPYKGIIRHCGWRFTKLNLPEWTGKEKTDVIAPAEVEIE
ncbi:MAG: DUF2760 domain-containing protein [Thermodesulfobacteria bacterium]|nr:DUF2760 domain-containing protein [Thermodesulfobacteriota bacterium]